MGLTGVHFALTDEQTRTLLGLSGDEEVMSFIEEIEENWDEDWLAESDKAWEEIHRCLTDGELSHRNGEYPFRLCILGGKQLYSEGDYIVNFIDATQVADLSEALNSVDFEWMRKKYSEINFQNYADVPDDGNFQYVWTWFQGIKSLLLKATGANRAVIFTADQ